MKKINSIEATTTTTEVECAAWMPKVACDVLVVLENVVKLYCPSRAPKLMSVDIVTSRVQNFSELAVLCGTKGEQLWAAAECHL